MLLAGIFLKRIAFFGLQKTSGVWEIMMTTGNTENGLFTFTNSTPGEHVDYHFMDQCSCPAVLNMDGEVLPHLGTWYQFLECYQFDRHTRRYQEEKVLNLDTTPTLKFKS